MTLQSNPTGPTTFPTPNLGLTVVILPPQPPIKSVDVMPRG